MTKPYCTAYTGGSFLQFSSVPSRTPHIAENKTLITRDGIIVGLVDAGDVGGFDIKETVALHGALVTPGFIDCHTHLVFAGSRAAEWEARLAGADYASITQKGGGIQTTVNAVRGAIEDALVKSAQQRLRFMAGEGVTTVEIKSGYGLNAESERKLLRVIKKLKSDNTCNMNIVPTFLAAHSVPREYAGRAGAYIDEVCIPLLGELCDEGFFANVTYGDNDSTTGAAACDVFCEKIAFGLAETERLFAAAKARGIPLKAHNEQLSCFGGSQLLSRYGGLSSDHLEYLDEAGARALGEAGTVAVLLPLAAYFLREKKTPPVDLLRKYHVPIAVATDYNPGTSPFASLRLAMNAACTLFGLTSDEALAAVTVNAAQALGLQKTHGALEAGYKAEFCVWDAERPVEIFYEIANAPLALRVTG
jgi:imidazolonepropionase